MAKEEDTQKQETKNKTDGGLIDRLGVLGTVALVSVGVGVVASGLALLASAGAAAAATVFVGSIVGGASGCFLGAWLIANTKKGIIACATVGALLGGGESLSDALKAKEKLPAKTSQIEFNNKSVKSVRMGASIVKVAQPVVAFKVA